MNLKENFSPYMQTISKPKLPKMYYKNSVAKRWDLLLYLHANQAIDSFNSDILLIVCTRFHHRRSSPQQLRRLKVSGCPPIPKPITSLHPEALQWKSTSCQPLEDKTSPAGDCLSSPRLLGQCTVTWWRENSVRANAMLSVESSLKIDNFAHPGTSFSMIVWLSLHTAQSCLYQVNLSEILLTGKLEHVNAQLNH